MKIKFTDFGRCLICLHNPCECKLKIEEKSKCCEARASWNFCFKSCDKCGKKFEPIHEE